MTNGVMAGLISLQQGCASTALTSRPSSTPRLPRRGHQETGNNFQRTVKLLNTIKILPNIQVDKKLRLNII
jgi:hypothetical protein